jgi:hypothetical protein
VIGQAKMAEGELGPIVVAGLVGSLRERSFNRGLLSAAIE